MGQKIFIASDHGGFEYKKKIQEFFPAFNWQDMGPYRSHASDYPLFAIKVVHEVLQEKNSLGILICGTGQGMAITANKFQGIQAALCVSVEHARLAREHNNSNILCLGARMTPLDEVRPIVASWLQAPFLKGRHALRLNLIQDLGGPLSKRKSCNDFPKS